MVAGTIAAFLAIRSFGQSLEAPPPAPAAVSDAAAGSSQQGDVLMHVLVALVAVIAVGQILGRIFVYIGQPPVIGEVMAGILLGPSFLGRDLSARILPATVAPFLGVISELGVILYMFIVGLELNAGLIKGRARAAVATAHTSIVVPFLLGSLLALSLYPRFSSSDVPWPFPCSREF
jgi:Kef-type K+ transport system membrane component KefB